MTSMAVGFPVLPGKAEAARAFAREVQGRRRAEWLASETRSGMTREEWFLQSTPQGDMVIVHFESADPMRNFQQLADSQAPFEQWFKAEVRSITGVDLNQPPPQLPEPILSWRAS